MEPNVFGDIIGLNHRQLKISRDLLFRDLGELLVDVFLRI
jgi:hypothetical protein